MYGFMIELVCMLVKLFLDRLAIMFGLVDDSKRLFQQKPLKLMWLTHNSVVCVLY